MKTKFPFLAAPIATVLLLGVASGHADPLNRANVPADARWVVHLDVDALRNSRVGTNILQGVVADKAADVQASASLDLPGIIRGTRALTIYGADYESGSEGKGILLWQGITEIEQIASAYLIQQAEAGTAGGSKIHRVQEKPFPIYSVGDDIHAAVRPGTGLILGKSIEQIATAAAVLDGKVKNLAGTTTFLNFPKLEGSILFLAFGKDANIHPQANVLKLTNGGRLAIGERNGHLNIELILDARDDEATANIQQVVQGMIALATLTQSENPELQNLIRGTSVKVAGRQVLLNLSVPLEVVNQQLPAAEDKAAAAKVE